jgi:hypothetical protein
MKKLETTFFSLFPFIFIFEILICEEKEEGKKEKKDFFLFPFSFPDFFMFFFGEFVKKIKEVNKEIYLFIK